MATFYRAVGVVVLSMLICTQGRSEVITVKQFREMKDEASFKLYIHGVETGFLWANSVLEKRSQKPLYCQPPKLALTVRTLFGY